MLFIFCALPALDVYSAPEPRFPLRFDARPGAPGRRIGNRRAGSAAGRLRPEFVAAAAARPNHHAPAAKRRRMR